MKFFVVMGCGQFGRYTARTLYAGGADVLVIDRNEVRIEAIKNEVGQAVCADATDRGVLRALGVEKADTAIIALGETDLEASILACAAMSDLGVGQIIVRAGTELQGRILPRVGATRVVYPEKQMGEQLAKSILTSGIVDQVALATGQIVADIRPRRDFVGLTIQETHIREKYKLAVIGIQHPKRSVDDKGELHEEFVLHSIPGPEVIIGEDDILVVVGHREEIESVARRD